MIDVHKLLQKMVDTQASDLHLTAGSPPAYRINGRLVRLKVAPLTPDDTERLVSELLLPHQQKLFEEKQEVDLSFDWRQQCRVRANFYRQRGSVAAALRRIPHEIIKLEQLGLPSAVADLASRPSGLVLVTGPTGSGKSTTLAAIIDEINTNNQSHIITIEDPIEFLHRHKGCIVNQREVGSDTQSFHSALRYVLRQDPDVVLLGEIRDLESMEAALRISETGHLALATLHTNNTIQTIHRVLDFFPARQQDMVRTQLSFVLEGIVSQQLLRRADGDGQCLASELLIPTPAIRNLIREDKTHQIYSQMQLGQSQHGMQTLNQCLLKMVRKGLITPPQALRHSYDPEELASMLEKSDPARGPVAGR
jgi:twitching motility protein PilT